MSTLHKINNKKKLLFVSSYYENLKTYIPLIKCLENQYDVNIVAQYYPFGSDRKLNQSILKNFNGELIQSNELGDQLSWRRGKALKNRWLRLMDLLIKYVFVENKINIIAKEIIDRIKPDLIIVGSDGRTLEKHLIQYCETKNIKSICFQWALTVISKKCILESKTRSLCIKKKLFYQRINDKFFNIGSWLVKKFNGFLLLLINKKIKLKIKLNGNIRIYGQGNATKLALIGESSRKFQIIMGTPEDKLEVIGHPLYHSVYNNIKYKKKNIFKKEDIYKKLNLPLNAKFILWANNDSKKQYSNYYTDNYMFKSWEEKLLSILKADSKIYVVFKIHPVWNYLPDFKKLENISQRIKVISEIDIEDILPFSSALIVRYSMAAIYGVLFHVPLISFNYPPLPAGSLFKEIGGSIHIKDNRELEEVIKNLLLKNTETLQLIEENNKYFLNKHLSINTKKKNDNKNEAVQNFKKLISKLLEKH